MVGLLGVEVKVLVDGGLWVEVGSKGGREISGRRVVMDLEVVDEILVGELDAMPTGAKPIAEGRFLWDNYDRQIIHLENDTFSVGMMLTDDKFGYMDKYVAQDPDGAEKLFDRLKMHRCFENEARALGTSYFMKYFDDEERRVNARLIGQELGLLNEVSKRNVDGEAELMENPGRYRSGVSEHKGKGRRGNPGAGNKRWWRD